MLGMQIQHFYAHSAIFPSDLHHRTVMRYDMDYHHEIMISPRTQDIILQKDKVLVCTHSLCLVLQWICITTCLHATNASWHLHPCTLDPHFSQRCMLTYWQHKGSGNMQKDEVYKNMTTEQQMVLWEQGVCPGNEVWHTAVLLWYSPTYCNPPSARLL